MKLTNDRCRQMIKHLKTVGDQDSQDKIEVLRKQIEQNDREQALKDIERVFKGT